MVAGSLFNVKENSKSHFEKNPTLLNRRSMYLRGFYLLVMKFRTSYRIYIGCPGRALPYFKQTLTFSAPGLRFIVYWESSTSLASKPPGIRRN
jgi:hypothetical protein